MNQKGSPRYEKCWKRREWGGNKQYSCIKVSQISTLYKKCPLTYVQTTKENQVRLSIPQLLFVPCFQEPECIVLKQSLKKIWCIHTMEYYNSPTYQRKSLPFVPRRINLKNILLYKDRKTTYDILFPYVETLAELIEQKRQGGVRLQRA